MSFPTSGISTVTVRVTDPGDDGAFDTLDDRSVERAFRLSFSDSADNWHNVDMPMDVNGDGEISPLDALQIVSYLNGIGASELPPRLQPISPYVDTNGDGFVSPVDAFLVIQRLNNINAEGEASEATTAEPNQILKDTAIFELFQFENHKKQNIFGLDNSET